MRSTAPVRSPPGQTRPKRAARLDAREALRHGLAGAAKARRRPRTSTGAIASRLARALVVVCTRNGRRARNVAGTLDMHIDRNSRSGRERRRCVAGSSPKPWRRRDDAQLPASRRSGRSATRARRAVHQPSENHVFGACCTRAKTCASELRRSWRTASIHESPAGPKRASAGATARRRGRRDEISGLVLTRQQTGPQGARSLQHVFGADRGVDAPARSHSRANAS